MKTKTIFLVCLLMGIGLTRLQAQKGNNGNGTESYRMDIPLEIPLLSEEGVQLDLLTGTITFHFKDHYVNGVCTRSDYNATGTLVSETTSEEFKYNEIGKQTAFSWITDPESNEIVPTGFGTWTERLVGSMGTRVKMEFYMDYYPSWAVTVTKISWPGDKYYTGN